MPARTNHFQKLIKVINTHLAPVGAVVTESALLDDNESKCKREVDILIVSMVMNFEFRIGIECTAQKSRVNIKQLESFKEKHRKIGIHQCVVVSNSGFSKSAQTYAEHHKIRLLSFEAAENEDWLEKFKIFRDLSFYGRSYKLKKFTIFFDPDRTEQGFDSDKEMAVIFNGTEVPVHKFVYDTFANAEFSQEMYKELISHEKSGGEPIMSLGLELGDNFEFKDKLRRSAWATSMTIDAEYKSNYKSLNAKQVNYEGKDIIIGGFHDSEGNAHIAISEIEGGLKATVEFTDKLVPTAKSFKRDTE